MVFILEEPRHILHVDEYRASNNLWQQNVGSTLRRHRSILLPTMFLFWLPLILHADAANHVKFRDVNDVINYPYSVLISVHITNHTTCTLPFFFKSLLDIECPHKCSIRLCFTGIINSSSIDLNGRHLSVTFAIEKGFQYLLAFQPNVLILNRNIIRESVLKQKPIMAPLFRSIPPAITANFATHDMNFNNYEHIRLYDQLLDQYRLGCFLVPSISTPYFLNLSYVQSLHQKQFGASILGHNDVYVCNRVLHGYMVRYSSLYEQNPDLFCDGFDHLLSEYQLTGPNLSYIPLPSAVDELKQLRPLKNHYENISKSYVINLDRRPDRRNRTKETLDLYGLPAEFVSATDGIKLKQQDLDAQGISVVKTFVDPYNRRPVNMGEVACFLSHYRIWENAEENKYATIMVLEDDARFEFLFPYHLSHTLRSLELLGIKWDMIYLGRKIMDSNEKFLKEVNTLVHPHYSHWTVAYLLSRRGIRKLLDQKPLSKLIPVDEYLPLMFDQHPNQDLKQYFEPRDMVVFAFQPVIVQPTHYYGQLNYVSDTENTTIIR
ncbi:hypothetical protein ACOME3_008491 [Neoechinorhynchus agilis]